MGQWITWWWDLPGWSSSRGKLCILSYHNCHIYRTCKRIQVGGEILKLSNGGQATKEWDHFYGGSWPLKATCKDFNLAIVGELGWMKWLKNWAGKCLYWCNFSCNVFFLMKILLVKLKYLYIQYAWTSIMKRQYSNQNGKIEKMVVPVKTFDHYHHKFHLLQLSCKIIKLFETEI